MKLHNVESVEFAGNTMTVRVDGRHISVDLTKVSPRLAAASPAQRARHDVSPSGYGIHWPDLDEDLSIDGLLGISHAPKGDLSPHVAEDSTT